MAEVIKGRHALDLRMAAVSHPGTELTRQLGLRAVREMKLRVPRKTGNLGRSIHVSQVTETSVTVTASAGYAGDVEFGTRPHEITPKAAKALRWAASPAGRKLSGAPRKGADVIFAKRVHHPGTKAEPFMVPGAKAAVEQSGLSDIIVNVWNDAA